VVKSAALGHIEEHAILRARFARHGIEASRVEARGASPHATMLAEYADIDVALDSFPYNGCIVTLEALWMGRPVLTIAGDTMVSRQSAAILACAGLDEYVAADAPSFVAKAAALAADRAALATASTRLRERLVTAGITDFRRFTSTLENAYRELWARALSR
jgi:predicted O-linked N-acetylglucosamine transferase (SPINDLY family)